MKILFNIIITTFIFSCSQQSQRPENSALIGKWKGVYKVNSMANDSISYDDKNATRFPFQSVYIFDQEGYAYISYSGKAVYDTLNFSVNNEIVYLTRGEVLRSNNDGFQIEVLNDSIFVFKEKRTGGTVTIKVMRRLFLD